MLTRNSTMEEVCTLHKHSPDHGYLVVDNEVNGAMCGVVWQIRKMKGLVDHALPSKRCIPMQENGHHLQSVGVMSEGKGE